MRRWQVVVLVLLVVQIPFTLALGYVIGHTVGAGGDAGAYKDVLSRIHDDFYRKTNDQKLSDAGLTAVVKSLNDPFSRYIPPKAYRDFEADTQGNFDGVGMNVKEVPRGLQILNVFDGGPAKKGGLKADDLIVAVNGKSLKGKKSEDATTEIKGRAGTTVKLTIVTNGKRRVVTLERAKVVVPVSEKKMETADGKKIGYVSLAQFTAGAHSDVASNVRALLKAGAKGIVFDLRHNGGGLLQEGVLTASIFISKGLIVSTHGRRRKEKRFTASGDAISPKIPVAVLVDGGTASASEIVTGALQDRKRATVVGQKTFGKGVFQEIEDLDNGGALDITVGEYFTPKGRNLGPKDGKRGLTPDVPVKDDPKTKRDEVLQRGLQVVAGKL